MHHHPMWHTWIGACGSMRPVSSSSIELNVFSSSRTWTIRCVRVCELDYWHDVQRPPHAHRASTKEIRWSATVHLHLYSHCDGVHPLWGKPQTYTVRSGVQISTHAPRTFLRCGTAQEFLSECLIWAAPGRILWINRWVCIGFQYAVTRSFSQSLVGKALLRIDATSESASGESTAHNRAMRAEDSVWHTTAFCVDEIVCAWHRNLSHSCRCHCGAPHALGVQTDLSSRLLVLDKLAVLTWLSDVANPGVSPTRPSAVFGRASAPGLFRCPP